MKVRAIARILFVVALTPFWACQVENPAQPSVSFVAPLAEGPADGTLHRFNDQPLTLKIVNTVKTGGATVSYIVEVARDSQFQDKVFVRADVTESPSGVTEVQIDVLPGDTTYFWRWLAVVEGVTGAPSATQSFFVRPQVIINAPALLSPVGGDSVFTARPNFVIQNSATTGPVGAILYDFEVSDSSTFAGTPLAEATIGQQGGSTTTWAPSVDLPEGTLFWRVRGRDPSNEEESPFSAPATFEREFGIDLAKVVYIQSPDISNWPETAQITSAFHSGGQLCITHTKLGIWPVTDFFDAGPILEGNQWVFANIDGTWYGGASEWYRPSQACKEVDEGIGHDSFTVGPLASWRPSPGEVFGVASTTPARLYPSFATLDQRSDVVLIVW
jgi:hypothetical protein